MKRFFPTQRIRLAQPLDGMPVGSKGTVINIYNKHQYGYVVIFDEYRGLKYSSLAAHFLKEMEDE